MENLKPGREMDVLIAENLLCRAESDGNEH